MTTFQSKALLVVFFSLVVNSYAIAQTTKAEADALAVLAAAQVEKDTKAEKTIKASLSAELYPLMQKTQESISEAMGNIRSDLAGDLELKTKQFLAEPDVYASLINMAYQRRKQDPEPKDDSFYVAEALSSLNGSLRLTPGVMGDAALVNRARLISQVAGYYSDKDTQMCRYIPGDFSILMSVDTPWLVGVDADVFHQAMDDEYSAIKLMLTGVLPRNVNDSDKQKLISKFAGNWLDTLPANDRYMVGVSKKKGNYCVLWKVMLKDMTKMAETYPDTSKKLIAPFLLSMSRGWMDSGLWSYEVDQVTGSSE